MVRITSLARFELPTSHHKTPQQRCLFVFKDLLRNAAGFEFVWLGFESDPGFMAEWPWADLGRYGVLLPFVTGLVTSSSQAEGRAQCDGQAQVGHALPQGEGAATLQGMIGISSAAGSSKCGLSLRLEAQTPGLCS